MVEDNNMSTNTPTNKVWIKNQKKKKIFFHILTKENFHIMELNMGIILMTYKKRINQINELSFQKIQKQFF